MSEIEKALAELKGLMKYRTEQLGYEEEFRGLGLTSRKNLCLHPSVKREKSGAVVDSRCRNLTAGFVKEKKERGEDVEMCVYHEVCMLWQSVMRAYVLIMQEPRPSRATQFDTAWRLHVGRPTQVRRRAKAMPLLHSSSHGRYIEASSVSR
jgi:DEAD_2